MLWSTLINGDSQLMQAIRHLFLYKTSYYVFLVFISKNGGENALDCKKALQYIILYFGNLFNTQLLLANLGTKR